MVTGLIVSSAVCLLLTKINKYYFDKLKLTALPEELIGAHDRVNIVTAWREVYYMYMFFKATCSIQATVLAYTTNARELWPLL